MELCRTRRRRRAACVGQRGGGRCSGRRGRDRRRPRHRRGVSRQQARAAGVPRPQREPLRSRVRLRRRRRRSLRRERPRHARRVDDRRRDRQRLRRHGARVRRSAHAGAGPRSRRGRGRDHCGARPAVRDRQRGEGDQPQPQLRAQHHRATDPGDRRARSATRTNEEPSSLPVRATRPADVSHTRHATTRLSPSAATTEHGCLASYSNYGTGLDLVAPGGGRDANITNQRACRPGRRGSPIYQITLDERSRTHFELTGFIGTSMASPHVAATAALVVASGVVGENPSPAAIEARLEQTARVTSDAPARTGSTARASSMPRPRRRDSRNEIA